MTRVECRGFSVTHQGRKHRLDNAFKCADISDKVFDIWYNHQEQGASVDSPVSAESVQHLIDFLNGKEVVISGTVDLEEIMNLAVEWGCDGLLAAAMQQDLRSCQWISTLKKLREFGCDTTFVEEQLKRRLEGDDMDGIEDCPAEVVLRLGPGLGVKKRIAVAKRVKGFVGAALIEEVTGLEVDDEDIVGLGEIEGGEAIVRVYNAVNAQQQELINAIQLEHNQELHDMESRIEHNTMQLNDQLQRMQAENAQLQERNRVKQQQQTDEINRLRSENQTITARFETQINELGRLNAEQQRALDKKPQQIVNCRSTSNPWHGIFRHLEWQTGGNPAVNGTIEMKTMNNFKVDRLKSLAGTSHEFWESVGNPNPWFTIDFKASKKVSLTGYTLMNLTSDNCCLRSWVVEGSNNGSDWRTLDTHNNDQTLKSYKQIAHFAMTATDPYQIIRFKATGKNSGGDWDINLCGIELFGDLLST